MGFTWALHELWKLHDTCATCASLCKPWKTRRGANLAQTPASHFWIFLVFLHWHFLSALRAPVALSAWPGGTGVCCSHVAIDKFVAVIFTSHSALRLDCDR